MNQVLSPFLFNFSIFDENLSDDEVMNFEIIFIVFQNLRYR